MSRTAKFRTSLMLSVGGEFETEFPVLVVEYAYSPSSRGARDRMGLQLEPDEGASVEIIAVYVEKDGAKHPLPEWMVEAMDADLQSMCLREYEEDEVCARDDAADRRYQEMREERLWERSAGLAE